MVEIETTYEGDLRCKAVHGPSKTVLLTDPPVDNMGRGESFSPTDLVATALGTCMLTTMAIVREKEIGTMEQLMVTPIRPFELILGKTLPFVAIGFWDLILVMSAACPPA